MSIQNISPTHIKGLEFLYEKPLNSKLYKRISDAAKAKIKEAVSGTDLTPEAISAFQNNRFYAPIFSTKTWVDSLLKAHLEGKVDSSTMYRALLYNACHHETSGHVFAHQVFDANGAVNKLAFSHLKDAMRYFLASPNEGTEHQFLNESQMNEWIEKLRADPKGAVFFLLPYQKLSEDSKYILDNLNMALDTNRFLHRLYRHLVVIFPPEMFHEALKIKFGEENVLNPLYIFGQREWELLTGKTRPIRIPCPGVECPEFIHDNLGATDLSYYLHDMFYHMLIESAIGKEHRSLWNGIAKEFKRLGCTQLFELLIDREMMYYPLRRDLDLVKRFWLAFNYTVARWKDGKSRSSSSFPPFAFEMVAIRYILENKQRFARHGISIEQFEEVGKTIADYLTREKCNHLKEIADAIAINLEFPSEKQFLPSDEKSATT